MKMHSSFAWLPLTVAAVASFWTVASVESFAPTTTTTTTLSRSVHLKKNDMTVLPPATTATTTTTTATTTTALYSYAVQDDQTRRQQRSGYGNRNNNNGWNPRGGSSTGNSPFSSRSYQDSFSQQRQRRGGGNDRYYNGYGGNDSSWWERSNRRSTSSSSYYGNDYGYGSNNHNNRNRYNYNYDHNRGQIQGGSRQTFFDRDIGNGLVTLETDGRPLNANVDLWEGPDHTPQSVRVYSEDGYRFPFQGQFHNTNNGGSHARSALHVRNTGSMEFPISAHVDNAGVGGFGQRGRGRSGYNNNYYGSSNAYNNNHGNRRSSSVFDRDDWNRGHRTNHNYRQTSVNAQTNDIYNRGTSRSADSNFFSPTGGSSNNYYYPNHSFLAPGQQGQGQQGQTVQGGALRHFTFADARRVQVDLHTDGMPLMAQVELWQGPNCVKQVAEIYSEDGLNRPFSQILDLDYDDDWYAGSGTIAIRNTGDISFPLQASVEAV